MNLKGLTEEQAVYLRDSIEMQVSADDGPVLVPLLEASVGRIAANLVRKQNAEMIACGYRPERRMSEPGKFDAYVITAGLYAVRGVIGSIRTDDLDHIIDWLKASVLANAPWLHHVDEQARPKKLMKCASIADLVREADKAMDKLNAQRARSLGPDDEQHVSDLADGYTLVRLLTPAALDLESSRMHHCVGHGAYDGDVESGYSEIYSLRDRMGRPVVTMEVGADRFADLAGRHVERRIRQVQGKRNDDPADEHLAILKPFILASGWEGEYGYWPRVRDISGTVHDLYDILAGTRFRDLQVCVTTDHGDITLPEGLVVEGELELRPYRRRIEVGENTVAGSLSIFVIDSDEPMVLPESLQVEGEISLPPDGEGIVCVPDHLAGKVRRRERPVPFHPEPIGDWQPWRIPTRATEHTDLMTYALATAIRRVETNVITAGVELDPQPDDGPGTPSRFSLSAARIAATMDPVLQPYQREFLNAAWRRFELEASLTADDELSLPSP